MEAPKQLSFEQAKKPEDARLSKFAREYFSDFLIKFRPLEEEAKELGVDVDGAIKFLETGEGDPKIVVETISDIREQRLQEGKEKIESVITPEGNKLLTNKEEWDLIVAKIKHKYYEISDEFERLLEPFQRIIEKARIENRGRAEDKNFSAGRENVRKEEISAKDLADLARETKQAIERDISRGQESPEWTAKVKKAREEFQKSIWDTLRIVVDLYKELGKAADSDEKSKEILDKINFYNKSLEMRAEELANGFQISRGEIFRPEENPEKYLSREYVDRGSGGTAVLEPPAWERAERGGAGETDVRRKAFLEFKKSVEKISIEKAGCFDKQANLFEFFNKKNLSPEERSTAERELEAVNARIKEIDEEIESKREEVAKKYGVPEEEFKFDFDIRGEGREPYSSV